MNESDEALVRKSMTGDRASFEELVRRTARLVFSRVFLEVGDVHRSEDLVQETFLIAWKSIRQVSEPGGFRSWLFTIAHSVVKTERLAGSRQGRRDRIDCGGRCDSGDCGRKKRRARAGFVGAALSAGGISRAADAAVYRRGRLPDDWPAAWADEWITTRDAQPRVVDAPFTINKKCRRRFDAKRTT